MIKRNRKFLAGLLIVALGSFACSSNIAAEKSSSTPSPLTEESKEKELNQGKKSQSTPASSEDENDPDFLDANKAVDEYAKKFWSDRFIQCGVNKFGDKRWFSSIETEDSRRYMEVINLTTTTTPPARLNSADRLNRVWRAATSLQSKASRKCGEKESKCGSYDGGIVLLQLGSQGWIVKLVVSSGKVTSEFNKELNTLYRPTCEEIKKHPIWNEY